MPLFREAPGSGGIRTADSSSGATNPWRTRYVLTERLPALIHPAGTVKLGLTLAAPPVTRRGRHRLPPLVCWSRPSKRPRKAQHLSMTLRDRSRSGSPTRRVVTRHDDHVRFRHDHAPCRLRVGSGHGGMQSVGSARRAAATEVSGVSRHADPPFSRVPATVARVPVTASDPFMKASVTC